MKDIAIEFWGGRVRDNALPIEERYFALSQYLSYSKQHPLSAETAGGKASGWWVLTQIVALMAVVPFGAYHFGHKALPKVLIQLGIHVEFWLPSAACLLAAFSLGVATLAATLPEGRHTVLREFVAAGWIAGACVAAAVTVFAYA